MAYSPTTDFVGVWRNVAGALSKVEMPGLDFVVAAMARAGLLTVTVSATAPTANQSTTAWLETAVPSTSAEGQLFLWDPVASAYAAATPKLLLYALEASAGQSGVSWWTATGGAPANTVGNNGDFAVRTDQPGGIYGPKTAGVWPGTPLPGTTTGFASEELDAAFGGIPGSVIYRDALVWEALAIGAANTLMASNGSKPFWDGLSALMDATFGNVQGSVLYRDAEAWSNLAPGASGYFLQTKGADANPAWAPEFDSGTVMLFQQSTAPTGWTKLTDVNDVGLRVVSGAVGSVTATAFSTVFAQTATAGHALTIPEMPSHNHPTSMDGKVPIEQIASGIGITGSASLQANQDVAGGFVMSNTGGGGAHSHNIALNLSYVDVIRASKN